MPKLSTPLQRQPTFFDVNKYFQEKIEKYPKLARSHSEAKHLETIPQLKLKPSKID